MRIVFTVFIALVGCSASPDQDEKKNIAEPPHLPVVTDSRNDLVLSWFLDAGPQVAASVANVPEGARGEVRVQDPTIPHDKRDPSWIFLADLTARGADGRYPVRAELRAKYEEKRRRAAAVASGPLPPTVAGSLPPAMPLSGAKVVMYATRHCPVCKKARRWLLDQKIPYIERDLEKDSSAARDLAQKGKAQGVPVSGVPVFEINGRLLPGFDPAAIVQLLAGTPRTQLTI